MRVGKKQHLIFGTFRVLIIETLMNCIDILFFFFFFSILTTFFDMDQWDCHVDECQITSTHFSSSSRHWTNGLRIADDRSRSSKRDLVLGSSRLSPIYLRDAHEDALRDVVRKLEGGPGFLLANSAKIVSRLRTLFPFVQIIGDAERVCSGVWRFQSPADDVPQMRLLLARIGATPSLYQLLMPDETRHQQQVLASDVIFNSSASPGDCSPGKTCDDGNDCSPDYFAKRMVDAFGKTFGYGRLPCCNVLESALAGISCTRSEMRKCRLLELICDEIFAELEMRRPFSSCNECLHTVVSKRYGLTPCQSFLFSGGMDALSSCLSAALRINFRNVQSLTQANDYVEMQYLLQDINKGAQAGSGVVLFATLAPSAPSAPIDVESLISQLERVHEPFLLLVDVTIESRALLDCVNALIRAAIAQPACIGVALCKSLQKYATLGLAKVSGGTVVFFPRQQSRNAELFSSYLKEEADALDWNSTPGMCVHV